MSIAMIPGSFDPITLGHINIIERAAKVFDEVVVAVMINSEKEYMFTMEQRKEFAIKACAHLSNVRVVSDSGMVVDLFNRIGASVIVKGVRNARDLEYEQMMAEYNRAKNPKAETMLLNCDNELSKISSTYVRECITEGKSLDGVAPQSIIPMLVRKK